MPLTRATRIGAIVAIAAVASAIAHGGSDPPAAGVGVEPGDEAKSLVGASDVLRLEPRERATRDGFRMEGVAEVEIVFGDTQQYKARIDRFYALNGQMEVARRDFYRYVYAILEALGQTRVTGSPPLRRSCPRVVADPYGHAYRAGQRHRDLGAKLEAHFDALVTLDRMGESTGLTPDYRWKVNRVRQIYRDSLRDYREMRTIIAGQIRPELAARRCTHTVLMDPAAAPESALADGPGDPSDGPAGSTNQPVGSAPTKPADANARPSIVATPVTIFVDNRGCGRSFVLFLDGSRVGRVPSEQRVAFPARPGRRTMCLLGEDDSSSAIAEVTDDQPDPSADGDPADSAPRPSPGAVCGQLGTVRSDYVHYGWTLATQCR